MKTTLNQIRACAPCGLRINNDGTREGLCLLMHTLGKTKTDDADVSILQILDSNGLDDATWCLQAVKGFEREKRLFAVACAREVQNLMTDPRSIAALVVAERFANGCASQEELAAARHAARHAAADAAAGAAWSAAWSVERDAAVAARDAADAGVAAQKKQEELLRALCTEIEARV